MIRFRLLVVICLVCLGASFAVADDPVPPYMQEARSLMEKASASSAEVKDFADEVLIGSNFLRNADAEYKKNLSWSGKLDEKAEPTVRYYSAMAKLHAAIVLSRVEKITQEKERIRLEGEAEKVKAKIKIFDDRVAEIASLKGNVADLTKQLAERKGEVETLNAKVTALTADVTSKDAALAASMTKGGDVSRELAAKQKTIADLEQKSTELAKSLESAKTENSRLQSEMAALSAKKGAEVSEGQEKIQALNRSQQFIAEVGKLGGVIKTGTDSLTAIFPRSSLIKTGKSASITADGEKLGLALAELLTNYKEYRVMIRVHGFGQPAKSEDSGATDQMARLLREVSTGKGKLDPAAVEAIGVGPAEPAYTKSNPEGNRRVELVFVKKQGS